LYKIPKPVHAFLPLLVNDGTTLVKEAMDAGNYKLLK
jgi:hypothetical protein